MLREMGRRRVCQEERFEKALLGLFEGDMRETRYWEKGIGQAKNQLLGNGTAGREEHLFHDVGNGQLFQACRTSTAILLYKQLIMAPFL